MIPTTSREPGDSGFSAAPRELDSRTSDGIHVRLLWHPQDGHVSVAVTDTKTADAFELSVRDRQSALDVFHHPYAYAVETHKSAHLARQPAREPIR